MPFDATGQFEPAIPFAFEDYLELTDALGRCVHPAKRGWIPAHRPRLLDQLGMDAETFIQQSSHLLRAFGSAIGAPEHLVDLAAQRQCRYLRGISMFAAFSLVWLAVVGLWLYAMFHQAASDDPARARRIEKRWILGGGVALPVVSITVLLAYGIPAGHSMLPLPLSEGESLEIHVTAHQWHWEVVYPESGIALDDELHIPAGKPVDVHLRSADVIHSFWVPRLGGKLDAVPGRTNVQRLQADEPGSYRGQCAEYCGVGHAHMADGFADCLGQE